MQSFLFMKCLQKPFVIGIRTKSASLQMWLSMRMTILISVELLLILELLIRMIQYIICFMKFERKNRTLGMK